jgi:hypothetical protein
MTARNRGGLIAKSTSPGGGRTHPRANQGQSRVGPGGPHRRGQGEGRVADADGRSGELAVCEIWQGTDRLNIIILKYLKIKMFGSLTAVSRRG